MRALTTVIYTDKLAEVRDFWNTHFFLKTSDDGPQSFSVFFYAESIVEYVDASSAGMPPTQGAVLRYLLINTDLEHERLKERGVPVSDLCTEHWNAYTGETVRYFTLTDPSGTRFQIFQDHFGKERQLMITGDGTETRKVHQKD